MTAVVLFSSEVESSIFSADSPISKRTLLSHAGEYCCDGMGAITILYHTLGGMSFTRRLLGIFRAATSGCDQVAWFTSGISVKCDGRGCWLPSEWQGIMGSKWRRSLATMMLGFFFSQNCFIPVRLWAIYFIFGTSVFFFFLIPNPRYTILALHCNL